MAPWENLSSWQNSSENPPPAVTSPLPPVAENLVFPGLLLATDRDLHYIPEIPTWWLGGAGHEGPGISEGHLRTQPTTPQPVPLPPPGATQKGHTSPQDPLGCALVTILTSLPNPACLPGMSPEGSPQLSPLPTRNLHQQEAN